MAKVVPKQELSDEEKRHLPVLREKEDPPVSIRLSGTAMTESGQLTKHKYFEFLHMDLDDYSDLEFTPEQAKKIRGHLARMSTGSSSMIPMTCSPQCPYRDRCEFYKMGKAPYGRQCIYEVDLLRHWTTAYFNEYQIDPNSFTEIGMINELAEIEIYMWRLNMILGRPENAQFYTENVVGVSPNGDPYYQKQLSVYLEAKERLAARKSKLIKLMVGDRQEKYKREAALKKADESDPSSSMAILRAKLERLSRDIQSKELEVTASKVIEKKETPALPPREITPNDIIGSDE